MSALGGVAAALERRLAAAQASGRLPSVAGAVWRSGEERARVGLGDPAPGADVQYRMGSITKTFTAVLVLQLRDEGRLRLDDPLDAHVPGTPAGDRPLRDLLAHLSGLRREPRGPFWEASPGPGADPFLADLHADDVVLPARRVHHYSNVAYGLLGQVVERASGASYRDALQRRLLDPLALVDTSYLPRAPHATGYRVEPFTDRRHEEPATDTGAMAPAGQLWSTPRDLCRWGTFLADPDPSVLAPDTADEMCEPVVLVDLVGWRLAHGLGPQLFRRGDRVLVGHGGSMPGFVAGLVVDRPSRTAVAVCTNAWWALRGTDLATDVLEDVLAAEPAAPPPWTPATSPDGLAELLGHWWWRGIAFAATTDGALLRVGPAADPRGPRASRFRPDIGDRYVGVSGPERGERLEVVRADDGHVRYLVMAGWILTRTPDSPDAGP